VSLSVDVCLFVSLPGKWPSINYIRQKCIFITLPPHTTLYNNGKDPPLKLYNIIPSAGLSLNEAPNFSGDLILVVTLLNNDRLLVVHELFLRVPLYVAFIV